MNDSNNDQPFLKRWSRLKEENKQNTTAEVSTPTSLNTLSETDDKSSLAPITGNTETHNESINESPTIELTDADMPPLESLDEDSDYTGFLSSGVSEELRKLALRKLFNSTVFHERDGLDDYDDDYSLSQYAPLGDIVTSDMKHQLEVEAQRELEKTLQSNLPIDTDDVDNTEKDAAIADASTDDADTQDNTNDTDNIIAASVHDDTSTINAIDIKPTQETIPSSQTSDTP